MNPKQSIAVIAGLLNAPAVRLSLNIQELGACDLALRTLAEASAPPAPTPAPASPAAPEPGESPAQP